MNPVHFCHLKSMSGRLLTWATSNLCCLLGARLNLGRGEVPDAFEAEERSVPGLGDLLHIVSGRTLIGTVRERRADRLDDSARNMQAYLNSATQQWTEDTLGTFQPLPSSNTSSSTECRPDAVAREAGSSILSHPSSGGDVGVEHSNRHASEECSQALGQRHKAGKDVEWQPQLSMEQDGSQESQILELRLQDELVAVAVRQKRPPASACSPVQMADDTRQSRPVMSSQKVKEEGQQGQRLCSHAKGKDCGPQSYQEGANGHDMISMYTAEGQLLCNLDNGQLHGGCLDGKVKFTVIRSATPLVRHLYFVAEAGLSLQPKAHLRTPCHLKSNGGDE